MRLPHNKNLKWYSSEIDVTWYLVGMYGYYGAHEVSRTWWHLTLTFDLGSCFRIFTRPIFIGGNGIRKGVWLILPF